MDLGVLFRNRKISLPFEFELAKFRIFTPGILLSKNSQKECGLMMIFVSKLLETTKLGLQRITVENVDVG